MPVGDRSGGWQQLWFVRRQGTNTMWSSPMRPAGLGAALPDALMERRPQRGTNRGRSGMVAAEHCRTQDKGFGGVRNTLTGWEG